jgi:hypothetical protein
MANGKVSSLARSAESITTPASAGPLFQIDVDGGMMSQKGGERPRKEFE